MASEHKKWLRGIMKAAQKQGFEVIQGRHIKLRAPSGHVVTCSRTPSNPRHVRMRILKDLAEVGFSCS